MEIAVISGGVRIKGKMATLSVASFQEKTAQAVLALKKAVTIPANTLVFDGAGEYEIGGVKISTIRVETDLIHSVTVDGVTVLIGEIGPMEKVHTKFAEHDIVLLICNTEVNPSFTSSLTTHATIFMGEKAKETCEKLGKANTIEANKYSAISGKFPEESQTIVLI